MKFAARCLIVETTVSFPGKKNESDVRPVEVLPPVTKEYLKRG